MRIGIVLTFVLGVGLVGRCFAEQGIAPVPDTVKIDGVSDRDGTANPVVGLGQRLDVRLSATPELDPATYILYLNGKAIPGLDVTQSDTDTHALRFSLRRNDANASAWAALLGAPTHLTVPVTIALGAKSAPSTPNIVGNGTNDKFNLAVAPWWRLLGGLLFFLVIVAVVWGRARTTALLKDNLLPQIAPAQQPYSLGRWQMAFWFTLVFASFVTLFIALLDYHTISPQALWLMGISGVTGVASIAVDIAKDTPADWANRGLVALGLKTYSDVERTRQEIGDRQAQLKTSPAPNVVQKLSLEIQDRQLLLRAYDSAIKPFITEGFWKDITTDMNGNALHRLQVVIWTWTLGIVFVIGVYLDLAMPQFDTSLLALMGLSSAGYIGYKYPEPQQ